MSTTVSTTKKVIIYDPATGAIKVCVSGPANQPLVDMAHYPGLSFITVPSATLVGVNDTVVDGALVRGA